MILYFKYIIHIDDFPLNGHPPSRCLNMIISGKLQHCTLFRNVYWQVIAMSMITDCIIMVLMCHDNAEEENISLTSMEQFILQPFP